MLAYFLNALLLCPFHYMLCHEPKTPECIEANLLSRFKHEVQEQFEELNARGLAKRDSCRSSAPTQRAACEASLDSIRAKLHGAQPELRKIDSTIDSLHAICPRMYTSVTDSAHLKFIRQGDYCSEPGLTKFPGGCMSGLLSALHVQIHEITSFRSPTCDEEHDAINCLIEAPIPRKPSKRIFHRNLYETAWKAKAIFGDSALPCTTDFALGSMFLELGETDSATRYLRRTVEWCHSAPVIEKVFRQQARIELWRMNIHGSLELTRKAARLEDFIRKDSLRVDRMMRKERNYQIPPGFLSN